MKISFTTLGCPEWDMDTIITRAVEYGYDGIDFRGYRGQLALCDLPEFSDEISETAKRIAGAGLEVSAFSSSAVMCDQDPAKLAESIEEVSRYAELCGPFGVQFIRGFGGRLQDTPRAEGAAIALATLEKMAAVAAPVCVAVETHDDWIASGPLAELMKQVRAKNVCVLWDVHHPFRFEGEPPRQTYDNLGPFTRCTHIKDSIPTGDGKYSYTLPGEGDVPLEEIISLLAGGGYDGYLTLEWEKQWCPEIAEPQVAFPAYAKYLRKLIS